MSKKHAMSKADQIKIVETENLNDEKMTTEVMSVRSEPALENKI